MRIFEVLEEEYFLGLSETSKLNISSRDCRTD